MRYVEFRDLIDKGLRENPDGLTWAELRHRLDLPYERACPTWVRRLEEEIGLIRAKGPGRAYIWKLGPQGG
jgi:hypothetical protein